MSLLENILALNARDIRTFPCVDKLPAVRFTIEASADPENSKEWFGPGGRYEKATAGASTDGLIVVDLDVKSRGPENMALLAQSTHRMPPTFTVRTASGGYHLYFKIPANADPQKYGNAVHLFAAELKAAGVKLADEKKTGIDIRSWHGFVVAPGSTINGKPYSIQEGRDIEIAEAPAWSLAAAERASRHGGVRRDNEELQRANVDVDQAEARARAIEYLTANAADIVSAKGAGGDTMAFRVACQLRDLGCTYDTTCELMRSEHWGNGYGWGPKLEAKPIKNAFLYGQNAPGYKVSSKDDYAVVTEEAPPAPDGRPVVWWDAARLHLIRPKVEELLQADDAPGKVLQRGRELVTIAYVEQAHVIRDPETKPILLPLAVPFTPTTLRERIMQSVALQRRRLRQVRRKDAEPEVTVEAMACPEELARLVLEVTPSAPVLAAIVDTPVVRLDGTVLQREGYDPETRMFGAFKGRIFLPVPERISTEDAASAYRVLVDELLADVPFATPADAAVKVAMLLTMIQRPMLKEAPVFYTSAADGGTGKTTSDEIVVFTATGERPPPSAWPGEDEYQASTMLHDLARQGARVVFFDNLPDGAEVKGASIESIVTAGKIQRRTVGQAATVAHEWTATLVLNGNNLQFASEGVRRRFLHCKLDAGIANPAERSFRRKDLFGWLARERPHILQAALAMIRGARLAGREPTYTLGFPEWARYVVAALEFAGAPSIAGKLVRDSVPNEADNTLRTLLRLWLAAFGKYPVRLREVMDWANTLSGDEKDAQRVEMKDAICAIVGKRWPDVTLFALNKTLRKASGRLIGGTRLNVQEDRKGFDTWSVTPLELAPVRTGTLEDLL